MIDDLLYGWSDLGRLAERAERFGLLLSHAHAVAVAQGPEPYGDGYVVTRTVESSLVARCGDRRILLTTKDGRLICVAPADEPDVLAHFAKQAYAATDGGRVAVGRAHPGAGGVVHSYGEALNALDIRHGPRHRPGGPPPQPAGAVDRVPGLHRSAAENSVTDSNKSEQISAARFLT